MATSLVIDVVLVQWIASLSGRDRSAKAYRPNFEDLFQQWKNINATFEDLYEPPVGEVKGISFLQRAIKAHQPASSLIRARFKYFKKTISDFDKSEKEFTDQWNKNIEDTATSIFFEFFPALSDDQDPEPKVYGSMSASEYRAQRNYASQFPVLDTTELVKQWREQQEYNLDIEQTLENVLGDKNETK